MTEEVKPQYKQKVRNQKIIQFSTNTNFDYIWIKEYYHAQK